MKRFVASLLIAICVTSCWSTDVSDSSLGGSVSTAESYFCEVTYMVDGVEYQVDHSQVSVKKISGRVVQVSLSGGFDDGRYFLLRTDVTLHGRPGNVEFNQKAPLFFEQDEMVLFDGEAVVYGKIVNNTFLKTKSRDNPAILDLEADISFEFSDGHEYYLRCFDISGTF